MGNRYLPIEIECSFPQLIRGEYLKTSSDTVDYNCIAHAANIDDSWWWPADGPGIYWPPNAEKAETVAGFVQAYATIGYSVCPLGDRTLEDGIEKIAIYLDRDGVPTHAARQIPSGEWTSKLGRSEDIQHRSLEALECNGQGDLGYGHVGLILRRKKEHSAP